MDRRQVDDVKTHGSDIWKPRFAIPEGSVTSRLGRAGSRKNFIPGRKARLFSVHNKRQRLFIPGSKLAFGITTDRSEQFFSECKRRCGLYVLFFAYSEG